MDQRTEKKPIFRGGMAFPLLALVLLITTLLGLFSGGSSAGKLFRAMEKTGADLKKKEEGVLSVLSYLQQGSVALSGTDLAVEYKAALPEGASLFTKKGSGSLKLVALGDRLALESPELLEKTLSGARGGAALLADSAFCLEETAESEALYRLFLALSDPALNGKIDVLSAAKKIGAKMGSDAEVTKAPLIRRGEEFSVTRQTYRLSSEQLVKGLDAFAQLGQNEEWKQALVSRYSLLLSLVGKEPTLGTEEAAALFLTGQGEAFQSLRDRLGKEKNQMTVEWDLYRGRVVRVHLSFRIGDEVGEGEIYFGKNIKTAKTSEASLSVRRGEETVFQCSASLTLSEDSKNAYVRELDYSVTDPEHRILTEKDMASGKFRYSWGKVKSDIGLRWITPERQIGFGGVLKEQKKGTVTVEISRVEIDRVNQLTGEKLTLTLSGKKPELELPASGGELFPQGEEKEALRQSFLTKYQELFGGNGA